MERRVGAAVALAVLLVLAGCTLGATPGEVRDTPTPTDAESATPTARPTASPWGDTVVVAIDNWGDPDRAVTPLAREATAYWETHAEQYAGYPIDYEIRPDAASPDIVLTFASEITACDGDAHAAGCAPLVTDARQIDRPERVWVRSGLSDDSTVRVLKHELGHTLGLTHDDPPQDVMKAAAILYTQPQPDATERAFPWNDTAFTVYVDTTGASDPRAARDQVAHALEYYADGAPGMPDTLTFTHVDDPDRAEIVVRYTDASGCGGDAGSCSRTSGLDPDGDGRVETYTNLQITLAGLDVEASGWHVGYWLAEAFGREDDAEKPPPFRDATYRERRSEWWR